MKHKVLAYTFVTLVFAATISVLYYQEVKNNISDNPLLPIHKNSTANWNTYTNDKYHYSFKYPKDLAVSTPTSKTVSVKGLTIEVKEWTNVINGEQTQFAGQLAFEEKSECIQAELPEKSIRVVRDDHLLAIS